MWQLALLIFALASLDMVAMSSDPIDGTKRLMGALVRQPPKLHDEMKLSKASAPDPKSPDQKQKKPRGRDAKPKSA
jgi:hypothetical protein